MKKPTLIQGGLSVDERGAVGFVNGCDLEGVRRLYTIRNHRAGAVRAWHGHREESKWIAVVAGTALVCAIPLADFEREPPWLSGGYVRATLSARSPAVLHVPPGYANGCMALEPGTVVLHLSDRTLEESEADDVRFPPSVFGELWEVKGW